MGVGIQSSRSTSSDRIRKWFSGAPVRIAVIIIALLWTLPTAGLLVSSLRPANDIKTTSWWSALAHPFEQSQWTVENYEKVLTSDGMENAFLNSLIVTIPAVVIPITIAAFAAYAFAWLEFPGRSVLFVIVVGLMVVPLQMSLIPLLRLYTNLDLNGTFLGSLVGAHRVRIAPGNLSVVRIHRHPSGRNHRVGARRWRISPDYLHAPGAAALRSRNCFFRDLPVLVGMERLTGRTRVSRHQSRCGGCYLASFRAGRRAR